VLALVAEHAENPGYDKHSFAGSLRRSYWLGLLIIAVSSGFFMNLLGAGTMASGGAAAYLILSHRK
jgi:uncharacterized membrane protein YjjP (DUF1212 family)